MSELETVLPNIQIRQESRRADIIINANGLKHTLRNKKVTIIVDNANLAVIEFDNEQYPIVRTKGDRLFYQDKKYSKGDAYGLPLLLGYIIVSTFYNMQTLFDIEQLVTISNLYLTLAIMALTVALSLERLTKDITIIEITQYLRHYKTIDPGLIPLKPLVNTYVQWKGYEFKEILYAVGIGFTLVMPMAFWDFIYDIDYLISWIATIMMITAVLSKGIFKKKEQFENHKMFGPAVVEAILEDVDETTKANKVENGNGKTIKGYKNLGILVNIEGSNKKERIANKEKLEQEYSNKMIIGLAPVMDTVNAIDSPERNFQTIISEVYSDHDFAEEGSLEILSAEDVEKMLKKKPVESLDKKVLIDIISNLPYADEETRKQFVETVKEMTIVDTGIVSTIINNLPENDSTTMTLKEMYREQDIALRNTLSGLSYLAQENKTRAGLMRGDKELIKNLQIAYNWSMSQKTPEPDLGKKKDNSFYYKVGAVSIGIIGILFTLTWMVESGVL